MRNSKRCKCHPCGGHDRHDKDVEVIVEPTVHCNVEERHHHRHVKHIVPMVIHQKHHHHSHHEYEVRRRFENHHEHHEHGRFEGNWCNTDRRQNEQEGERGNQERHHGRGKCSHERDDDVDYVHL